MGQLFFIIITSVVLIGALRLVRIFGTIVFKTLSYDSD